MSTQPSEHRGALELPELREAVLPRAGVEALVDDLRTLADDVHVQVRGGGHMRGTDDKIDVMRVPELLSDQDVHGVQIRYRFDGCAWCDTLMPDRHGVRVVRACLDGTSH